MVVTFKEEYLKSLYEEGVSNDKKHRFQSDIIIRYQKVINFIKSSSTIEDLWNIKSLRYEVLKGDKAGRSAVSVNMQYRVEFTVNKIEEEPILTICNILELNNHYK